MYIKGDWAELSSTTGLPTWQDKRSPCIYCLANKDQLYDYADWTPGRPPHGVATVRSYEEACNNCEHTVTADLNVWSTIKNTLAYKQAAAGPRGRALVRHVASAGLLKHDRLEPSGLLAEVGAYDRPPAFPVTATFWRRTAETRARHRNPLFSADIGVGVKTLAIDAMHTIWLGPAQQYCAAVFWLAVDTNFFDVPGASEERLSSVVRQIRDHLWVWYSAYEATHRHQKITRLQDLTPGMLGSTTGRSLSTKAAETRWLVPFCVHFLVNVMTDVDTADALIGIGNAFMDLCELMEASTRVMPAAQQQRFFDQTIRIMRLWDVAQLREKPKNHLMLELASRIVSRQLFAAFVFVKTFQTHKRIIIFSLAMYAFKSVDNHHPG